MTIALIPIIVMAVLYACGVFLMLERSVTRVLLGFLLVGNATNLLLIIVAGKAGVAPVVGGGIPAEDMTDPLPQALILTAIVITFGVSAFLLALIYRAWRLAQGDTLQDDEDDIALRTSLGVPGENPEDTTSDSDFVVDEGTELHELEEADAQAADDETEQSTITTDRGDS
ncbi:multisubunit sodium/proton antiporter MrpC subunit [Rhodoglobus vestalii]|uniref:Multisubunit sodium/proton antiporter MrpC subunit n=1 Tax=Rhodoglobus vestalii TaxID=193384 RepID=A0A8H2PXY2_9MICO|nr:Na(+)/H(+) antiporter subunit C [Rhodoglobus vestalii]TQO19764.1 multisubunit sodium/proton antiporter MrpC subunit [Rhodoglobus vestalii]